MPDGADSDAITILLADDNVLARSFAKELLTIAGFRVIEASNGNDAVATFMDHKDEIQLLLFDVLMPKMNGIEAYTQITKVRPDIEVIFVSGYVGGMKLDHPLIMKPYLPKQLFSALDSVLNRKTPLSYHFPS